MTKNKRKPQKHLQRDGKHKVNESHDFWDFKPYFRYHQILQAVQSDLVFLFLIPVPLSSCAFPYLPWWAKRQGKDLFLFNTQIKVSEKLNIESRETLFVQDP